MKYKAMTLKELKENCKEKGLKVSGTKRILIKRLNSPNVKDMALSKNKNKVVVGVGWGENDKSNQLGQLIQKGFATRLYYSCDVFYYEVDGEKWSEIIKNEKK
jgi:hypothetical protein|tara:strand:+ start:270 stop:578 length:309 start_codon:yes stop_codon:yes gene_type:complete